MKKCVFNTIFASNTLFMALKLIYIYIYICIFILYVYREELIKAEAYSEACHASKMERFCKSC